MEKGQLLRKFDPMAPVLPAGERPEAEYSGPLLASEVVGRDAEEAGSRQPRGGLPHELAPLSLEGGLLAL